MKNILALLGGAALSVHIVFAGSAYSQAPKPPPDPNVYQSIDLSKLDKARCEIFKHASLHCVDGDLGNACRSVRDGVQIKCKSILDSWSFFDIIPSSSREKLAEYIALILVAAAGLLATNILTWLNSRKLRKERTENNQQIKILEDRVLDPFFDRPKDFEQYATNLIFIGEGDSGKTTLLHALSGAPEASPDISTAEVSTYTIVHEISIEKRQEIKRRLFRIYSDDYVGQNWVQGAQNRFVPIRQRAISSSTLVIVVDVANTEEEQNISLNKPDPVRVAQQIGIYNDPSIQTLAQLLGTNGQIILFINKIDLLKPPFEEAAKLARQIYEPLRYQLAQLRGVRLRVIVGSATTGLGVVGYDGGDSQKKSLLRLVYDHAEKIDLERLRSQREGTAASPS